MSKGKLINEIKRLEEENSRLTNTLASIGEGIIVVDSLAKVSFINPVAEAITGCRLTEVINQPIELVLNIIDESTRQPLANPVHRVLRDKLAVETPEHTLLIAKDGREIPIANSTAPIIDPSGILSGAILVIRDETSKRKREKKLEFLSNYDSLTGVYNRNFFEQKLTSLEERHCNPLGVIVCDLDGLKDINDSLGHEAGDHLLKIAALTLKECFREEDIVARIGGDEFVILLTNCNAITLRNSCRRIQERVARYNQQHVELPLSISVGSALGSRTLSCINDILRAADRSMYQDKLRRKNNTSRLITKALRDALKHNNFCTEFQTT